MSLIILQVTFLALFVVVYMNVDKLTSKWAKRYKRTSLEEKLDSSYAKGFCKAFVIVCTIDTVSAILKYSAL